VHTGANAVLAWMMDDNSHPNFKWGLWSDKNNGMKLRPWFYPWSLLTKLFPAGSDIYKIRSRSINVRALGAKVHSNGKSDWSFCVVNLDQSPTKIFLKVDGESKNNLAQYLYKENEISADLNGFPKPKRNISVNLNEGIEFEIPPKSVLFLSSLIKP